MHAIVTQSVEVLATIEHELTLSVAHNGGVVLEVPIGAERHERRSEAVRVHGAPHDGVPRASV